MGYMGIYRGPRDWETPEYKAACENVIIGYSADGFTAWFLCRECGQSDMLEIKHKPDCETGKILAKTESLTSAQP